MVEVLVVIVVISALGSAGYMAVSSSREAAQDRKLTADVATVNSAVQVYLANGGSLDGVTDANEVLAKLKTRADATSASKTIGLTGSFLDTRAEPVWQSGGEAGTGQLRARWSPSSREFTLTSEGGAGIKEFRLNDSLAGEAPTTETRDRTKDAATEKDWVWDYTDRTNAVAQVGVNPESGSGTNTPSGTAGYSQPLQEPGFSSYGGSYSLSAFDMNVTLTNPNPGGSSQIYFSAGGSFQLYTGQILSVTPGLQIQAVAITLDPTRYSNSSTANELYNADPLTLQVSVVSPQSSLTYAAAGGAMVGAASLTPAPITINLDSAGAIPSKYENSSRFRVFYTADGSSPLTSSSAEATPAFTNNFVSPSIAIPPPAGWGGATTFVVQAAARATDTSLFRNSGIASAVVGITKTDIPTPTITPVNGTLFISGMTITIAMPAGSVYPVGTRIYYTQDGTDPGNVNGSPSSGATLYTGPFGAAVGPGGVQAITARAYGPNGVTQWFNPSSSIIATYPAITTPDGALVGSATLNGTFVGSLIYASPSSGNMQNINFNSGAQILKGNLYLPGTPTIRKSNGTVWSTATDSQFSTNIYGWEFDADGNRTQQTTPRVLNEAGSVNPSNYTVQFNNNAIVEGKIIRRHDSPAFPTIPNPPPKDSNGSTSLNSPPAGPISASQYSNVTINTSSVGDVTLLPGNFGNLTANNGTSFVLGNASNPDVPVVYSFQTLNLNSGAGLKIVGKVIITITGNINLNSGSVLGDINNPDYLQLQFTTGGLSANSGSYVYGKLVAPKGSVTFNAGSVFQGSVTAQTLTLNSNSVVFVLPPVIEN